MKRLLIIAAALALAACEGKPLPGTLEAYRESIEWQRQTIETQNEAIRQQDTLIRLKQQEIDLLRGHCKLIEEVERGAGN